MYYVCKKHISIEVIMRNMRLEEHLIEQEPFYLPLGKEVRIAEAAYGAGLPLLLKGPTGCGKTRFMQYDHRLSGHLLNAGGLD